MRGGRKRGCSEIKGKLSRNFPSLGNEPRVCVFFHARPHALAFDVLDAGHSLLITKSEAANLGDAEGKEEDEEEDEDEDGGGGKAVVMPRVRVAHGAWPQGFTVRHPDTSAS